MTEYINEKDIEPNYRGIFLIILFFGAIFMCIIPVLTETPKDMYVSANGTLVKIPDGYIRAVNGTPVPIATLPTPIIITNTVYVTPTPDNGIYYVSDTQNGTRKMGREFVFHRNDVNYPIKGTDLDFHANVYGYKMLDSFHWWNYLDNKWYEGITGDYPRTKYLFIYVQVYTDGLSGDDVRPWLPNEQHFRVMYDDMLYSPIPFKEELSIYELLNTHNLNDDSIIEYYGQFVHNPIMGSEAGKPHSNQQYYIYASSGIQKSNAIDGYIVYEIPSTAQEKDLQVWGDFFGSSSQWVLKT